MNKLVYQYSNCYHCSTGKKPIHDDYAVLLERMESNCKASKFKLGDTFRNTNYKKFFSKRSTKHWSREIVIDSVLKTNPSIYKTKDLNK